MTPPLALLAVYDWLNVDPDTKSNPRPCASVVAASINFDRPDAIAKHEKTYGEAVVVKSRSTLCELVAVVSSTSLSAVSVPSGAVTAFAVIVARVFVHAALSNCSL